MEIKEAKYIHCIGIGGIGLSSLAQILYKQGKKISGSDQTSSDITKSLKLSGIKVEIDHKETNIKKTHHLVIYSPAIPRNNIELLAAQKLGITCLTYPQALGQLTEQYYTIAIAGTHGKSTTTAMTAKIMIDAGMDPTVVIGTKMKELKNKNYRVGQGNYLIIEACEYKESFLHFNPNLLVITNIEADHLDYFKTITNYKKAFEKLVKRVPKDGTIIINADDKNCKTVIKNSKSLIVKWGKSKTADFQLKSNSLECRESVEGTSVIILKPAVTGEFNIKNAAAAAVAANILNIEEQKIEKSIKSFKGTWRRMQYKHKKNYPCQFIDDYAHHPTEIELTLNAIREKHPKEKLLVIFQPHQYSRTKKLLKEFGPVFTQADTVIIPNIYKVRDSEEDVKSVSVKNLVTEIKKYNKATQDGHSLEKTANFIEKNHTKYDLIITMGAGDITNIYKLL